MSEREQEGVLSRWSRRKLEAEAALNIEEDQPPTPPVVIGEPVVEEVNAETVDPVLTDVDMPPIESLDENSDFSIFMSSGVSDKLRNLALRKMFQAPSFNIRDGLDEYDDDFTTFEKLGDIVTCDMKHQIEMQELKKKEEAEEQALEEQAQDQTETVAESDEVEPSAALEETPEADDEEQQDKNDAI